MRQNGNNDPTSELKMMSTEMQTDYSVLSEYPVQLWVSPSWFEGRLDAEFYQPKYIRALQAVRSAGFPVRPLAELSSKKFRVYWGIKGLQNPPSAAYIPYIRPNEVGDDGWMEYEALTTIERHWADDLPEAIVEPGDLLVEVKGNARKVHVVRGDVPPLTFVSGSMYRFVPSTEIDSHYVWAYLTSKTSQTIKDRLMSNSIIKWINPEDICQLPVLLPPCPVQEYIGAKVRLAERCRLRARELRSEADRCLEQSVGIDLVEVGGIKEGKEFRALSLQPEAALVRSGLVSARLDPAAYSPIRLALLEALQDARCKFRPIDTVADDVTKKRRRYMRDKYSASYFVSILHLSDKGVVNFKEAETHHPVSSGIACEKGDVLFSGINPSQNRVAVWTGDGRALCSAEFSIYRAKRGYSPFFLSFVWRSAYCLNQLKALTRGTSSSRRRLKEEDFQELLVPILAPDDQALIAQNEETAVELDTLAAQLVQEAKADVEALIEGRLDVDGILAGRVRPPTWEDIEV